MSIFSLPWDGSGGTGDDGPYNAYPNWHRVQAALMASDISEGSYGVIRNIGLNLQVQPQVIPNATVRVRSGAALVQGIVYYQDVDVTVSPLPNGSGSTRYDVVVLEANYANKTVRVALVQGTPGGGVPTLTQTTGSIWQIPLAYLELPSSYTTINQSNIQQMRFWLNDYQALYVTVQNVSGSPMYEGMPVIYSNSATSAVTTTTTVGLGIAGVIQQYIPVNGFGQMQVAGVAKVRLNTDVAVGDPISAANVAGQGGLNGGEPFGRALAISTAGNLVDVMLACPIFPHPNWHAPTPTFSSALPTGCVWANGGTVGGPLSGATQVASNRARALFHFLWLNFGNSELTIQDSSGNPTVRGANADADFNNNRRLPTPDLRGRALVGLDNMGGSAANRITATWADVIGGTGGAETHTLTTAELASHRHDTATPAVGSGPHLQSSGRATATTSNALYTLNEGGGLPHANIQPSFATNYIIRL